LPRSAEIIGLRELLMAEEPDSSVRKDAARATGGLPVYCDVDGCLVLLETEEVVRYEPDTGRVTAVTEERWRRAALVAAARRFPSLADLRPIRPTCAITCESCRGEGEILAGVPCGVCMGTGWIEP
jgi:hypothetical protein